MHTLSIGAVFTPSKWANFAIEKFNLLEKWLNGATVFDPTMGEGSLLIALVESALQQGHLIENLPTQNLYGVEMNGQYYQNFLEKVDKYRLAPVNFVNADIFFLPNNLRFDIVFGNPPWQTFANLPESYKEIAKPLYFKYDLVGKAQDLLLGGSRIDIASLVIQKTILENLQDNGEAVFFMPLSLLLNDGANQSFRKYKIGEIAYAVEKIYDFGTEKVFENVVTRYGLVHFVRNKQTIYPISYHRKENEKWRVFFARPLLYPLAPLSITDTEEGNPLENLSLLKIFKKNIPRQGVNTCGANDIFFFKKCEDFDDDTYLLNNEFSLPKKFIFPLITAKNFQGKPAIKKWVLLPYKKNGKPLDWLEIEKYPLLSAYLLKHKSLLENRKGVMLHAMMRKDCWWAMLGVGIYNSAPYKVVWEAYGKTTFEPQIFEGHWQANQSLQCFVPCETEILAKEILAYLQDPAIESYLLSLKMEGTMNWAQAGKIKKLFVVEKEKLNDY